MLPVVVRLAAEAAGDERGSKPVPPGGRANLIRILKPPKVAPHLRRNQGVQGKTVRFQLGFSGFHLVDLRVEEHRSFGR